MNKMDKAALFLSLPAHIVDQIEELIDEAAEDGYQNGYTAGFLHAEGLFSEDEVEDER